MKDSTSVPRNDKVLIDNILFRVNNTPGASLRNLSCSIGRSASYMSSIVNDGKCIPSNVLPDIAAYFGIAPWELWLPTDHPLVTDPENRHFFTECSDLERRMLKDILHYIQHVADGKEDSTIWKSPSKYSKS